MDRRKTLEKLALLSILIAAGLGLLWLARAGGHDGPGLMDGEAPAGGERSPARESIDGPPPLAIENAAAADASASVAATGSRPAARQEPDRTAEEEMPILWQQDFPAEPLPPLPEPTVVDLDSARFAPDAELCAALDHLALRGPAPPEYGPMLTDLALRHASDDVRCSAVSVLVQTDRPDDPCVEQLIAHWQGLSPIQKIHLAEWSRATGGQIDRLIDLLAGEGDPLLRTFGADLRERGAAS